MSSLKIIPINDLAVLKLKKYIDSCTNPSVKDRLRIWKAKQVTNLIYRGMPEPKMLREEWDDLSCSLTIFVEDEYEQYSRELLENCKINFLKLVKASETDFSIEVLYG